MKNKKIFLSVSIALALTVFNACQNNTPTNQTTNLINTQTNQYSTSIKGQVQFPGFFTKAVLADVAKNSVVSIIEPSTNIIIANGLTDSSGKFFINPESNFKPNINQTFVLEASKRPDISKSINSISSIIKWTESGWNSITGKNIIINNKTSTLRIISQMFPDKLSPDNSINSVEIENGITNFKTLSEEITIENLDKIKNQVDKLFSADNDPAHLLDKNFVKSILENNTSLNGCLSDNNCDNNSTTTDNTTTTEDGSKPTENEYTSNNSTVDDGNTNNNNNVDNDYSNIANDTETKPTENEYISDNAIVEDGNGTNTNENEYTSNNSTVYNDTATSTDYIQTKPNENGNNTNNESNTTNNDAVIEPKINIIKSNTCFSDGPSWKTTLCYGIKNSLFKDKYELSWSKYSGTFDSSGVIYIYISKDNNPFTFFKSFGYQKGDSQPSINITKDDLTKAGKGNYRLKVKFYTNSIWLEPSINEVISYSYN